jgi:hypothetical protein
MAGSLRADLPAIRIERIAPLGAAAGSSVELTVTTIAAADKDEVRELRFDHPGVTAEWLRPGRFRVTVADDVPEGTYDARLVGRFGVSNPRLFAVSRGLTDQAEREPNNTPATAQQVPIDVAVAGTSDSGNHDLFRFAARRGQRLTLDCFAFRLDSEMDTCLTVLAPDGAVLATNADYRGRDSTIDFCAPADGDYLVQVNDLSYRGGLPYRLLITARPYVENIFPRAVEPGQSVELTALGYNFGPAGRPSEFRLNGQPLEEFRFTVTPPAEAVDSYRFLEHPTGHSRYPTAATCTLNGIQVRVPIPRGADIEAAPAAILMGAEGPVSAEREANDAADAAQALELPATVNGRFDRPRDADWYEFATTEAGRHDIQVYSERVAGQADPYVVVTDDHGERLAELDDFGPRLVAFNGYLRDPVGSVELAAGRKYRLVVRDRYDRGGARYQYVLTVRRPVPDFFVAATHSTPVDPTGTTVWRGGAAYVSLLIQRRDGFDGPLTISAEGLPPGLHAAPVIVIGDVLSSFVVWADTDAPAWTGPIRLIATGAVADRVLRREVRPYTRIWSRLSLLSSRPTRDLILAVREQAPFHLRATTDRVEADRGVSLELAIEATRAWPDCRAAIRVIGLTLPAGITMDQVEIPEGETRGRCLVKVGDGVKPGLYSITLLGQAQVPWARDPAEKRANILVSSPSEPITLRVRTSAQK